MRINWPWWSYDFSSPSCRLRFYLRCHMRSCFNRMFGVIADYSAKQSANAIYRIGISPAKAKCQWITFAADICARVMDRLADYTRQLGLSRRCPRVHCAVWTRATRCCGHHTVRPHAKPHILIFYRSSRKRRNNYTYIFCSQND